MLLNRMWRLLAWAMGGMSYVKSGSGSAMKEWRKYKDPDRRTRAQQTVNLSQEDSTASVDEAFVDREI